MIILSSNPESLAAAIDGRSSATVEAEYGNHLVAGSVVTLAHHGPRSSNPAPCLNNEQYNVEIIGMSHIDLDAVGGVLSIQGRKPGPKSFWQIAAFVDVHGPHKLSQSGANDFDIECLHAYWAWAATNKIFPPRDGSVVDVSDIVSQHCDVLKLIFNQDADLLEAGEQFRQAGEALNRESFISNEKGVILRSSTSFANHLYNAPDGAIGKAVIALNTERGNITLSFADPILGINAATVMQSVFGPEAGGRDVIAGTPRNKQYSLDDLKKVQMALKEVTG